MANNNGLPIYTALDEQRFGLWMNRLEDSYKNYLEVSTSHEGSRKKDELMATIRNSIKYDLEKYPHWIAAQKTIPAGKIASSSNDMKTFLRHIAFPHVLKSYHNIIQEICPELTPSVETAALNGEASIAVEMDASTATNSELAADHLAKPDEPIAHVEHIEHIESVESVESAAITIAHRHTKATLKVPMHTAPIFAKQGAKETAVEDFFRGLSKGHGDGLVNLCKLADINHRINRACEHDTHQVAQWVENEQTRRSEYVTSLAQRQDRLVVLRGEDEGGMIQQAVGKLKSEISVLSKQLSQAEKEEEEARRVYEAAILKRRAATQNIVNLEGYIDNVAMQRDLLKKVNDLRVEADKYNIASAESRVVMFQGLEKYVQTVHEQFVQRRLGEEMPELFCNLANVFGHILTSDHHSASSQSSHDSIAEGENSGVEKLSLFCAARVGLETIRIWQQLHLHIIQPALVSSIEQFQSRLTEVLATQRLPTVNDTDAASVYRASNATVVLFFDHLAHDTPEDHVEANSRVLTCLKMLTDHLQEELSSMEVDSDYLHGKQKRSMQMLNCNDVLSPPVWCLPLAHSPQYLAQLWRLAEEAHNGDLYVPLEFDTEWVSEDPYHTSSDEEGGSVRRRQSSTSSGHLMRNVEFDEPWANAMSESERAAFTKLLTPASADHLVAKVIKRMDARVAQRNTRIAKAAPARSRPDERERSAATGSHSSGSNGGFRANNVAAAEAKAVPVRTPMGLGNLLTNYRRDGMISVTLQWGAVGHFRKECVEFLNPPVQNDPTKKAERPSLSAAQAFYVTGSAGRFLHNDMELHNTMARLVSLVRVQRIIGDFVVINHANLSLYMHGRTSSGLTKTIEATIAKWVNKFDPEKLSKLLDFAEQSNAKGATVDPQEFLRMLEKTAVQQKPTELAKVNRQLVAAAAFESLPDDAEDSDDDDSVNNNETTDAARGVGVPNTSAVNIPAPSCAAASSAIVHVLPRSCSATSMSSSIEPVEAAQLKKVPRKKAPTDVKLLAKYSKDGETLRELMMTIMRNLKVSHGTISNEYYRNFRYETSQGGVAAWFNFRGNSSTFDAMNHCAMMWAEDHKDQLSAEEQQVLGEVCKRMRQTQHAHGNSQALPTHHLPLDMGKDVVSPAASLVDLMGVFAGDATITPAGAVPHTTAGPGGYTTSYQAELGTVASTATTKTAVSSNNTVSSDEGGEDGAMDEDTDVPDVIVEDTGALDKAVEKIIHDVCAADQVLPPAQLQAAREATFADVRASVPLMAKLGGSHQTSILAVPEPSESAAANTASVENVTNANVCANTTAPTCSSNAPMEMTVPASPVVAIKEEGAASPQFNKADDIRTIEDLHRTVVYEMNRRKVSQSKAAIEANLRALGMGQPALSKFLSVASINNNDRGKQFSEYMLIWVKYSQQQPSTSDWDPAAAPLYRAPKAQGGGAGNSIQKTAVAVAAAPKPVKAPEPYVAPAYNPVYDDNLADSSDEEDDEKSLGSVEETLPAADEFLPDRILAKAESSRGLSKQPSVNEGEELTCGLCGKLSTEFVSNKSFHMHLAWCYRRKNQTRPPPDHMLKSGGAGSSALASADWVANSDNAHNKKRKSSGGLGDDSTKRVKAASEAFRVTSGTGELKDSYVITADSFKLGHHYESCEMCKEHGEVIKCNSCPCIYHPRCADMAAVPEGKWFCPKCVETGASVGELVTVEQKCSANFPDSWILVYSDALHRWRKAVVLEIHPTRPGVVMVKWWRIDNKGGKTNWLDLSNATILSAGAERLGVPANRSRSTPSAAVNLISASRERQQTVRFESENFEKKKSNSGRFRDDHGMMFMDGETGGSVPPLVRASAAGIGGVAALRDGEYEEGEKSTGSINISGNGMSDTYLSSNSLKAALCASGSACRAVDIAICNENTNVFVCSRPPGHHAGRYGCTGGCLSTGFCLLNNAAIAAIYGRVRWGLERVAVVDIDVHFGNGTAELLRNDPNAFFASVHMIYGEDNDGLKTESDKKIDVNAAGDAKARKPRASSSLGFYPARMGLTEVTDTYVSVGVYPTEESSSRSRAGPKSKTVTTEESSESEAEVEVETEKEAADAMDLEQDQSTIVGSSSSSSSSEAATSSSTVPTAPKVVKPTKSSANRAFVGSEGFLKALEEVIIPQMEKFRPQLLIISAGFDGYVSDPLGGQLCLSLEDYKVATKMLMASMARIKAAETDPSLISGKVISLLEGGYDTSPFTLGLAKCVDAHVHALQEG